MSLFYPLHKSKKALALLLLTAALFNCSSEKERSSKIDYLGQKPPGMKAELFAPGIISTNLNEHSAIAFAPDGSAVLWSIMDKNFKGCLFEMKYTNGSWTKPAMPSFADTLADYYCPCFSIDGKKLFFSSRRKAPAGYPEGRGNRIWSVDKTTDGWGISVPFDTTVSKSQEFSHSISQKGTLYFSSSLSGTGTSLNICKAEKTNDGYAKPVLLPYNINSVGYEDGPYIAPDEDFLIFESTRPEGIEGSHDLYISFKDKDGRWGIPTNMGPKINSGSMERFPRLSPDGKYFFFASNRDKAAGKVGFDIYWIDAKVIDELRNTGASKDIIEQPLGDEILDALDKSNISLAAGLLKLWNNSHPNSIDATVIQSSTLRKQKKYSEADQLLANKPSQWSGNTDFILEKALVKFGLTKEEEAVQLLTPILKEGNQLRGRYIYLSNALFAMEKFKPSDEYFEKAMAIHPDRNDFYNRACAYALIGEKNMAFENLNKAVEHGYNSKRDFENDADLQSLKSDSRFQELMAKLK